MSKEEVELAGFIVAALSVLSSALLGFFGLRYSYKARMDAKAETLYSKKVEAYCELLQLFATFYGVCVSNLKAHKDELEGDRLESFKRATYPSYVQCNDLYRKWSFVLPSESNYLAISFMNSYSVVTKHTETRVESSDGSILEPGDSEKVLEEALFAFFNEARREMGIEALSKSTREQIEKNAGEESWILSKDNKSVQS